MCRTPLGHAPSASSARTPATKALILCKSSISSSHPPSKTPAFARQNPSNQRLEPEIADLPQQIHRSTRRNSPIANFQVGTLGEEKWTIDSLSLAIRQPPQTAQPPRPENSFRSENPTLLWTCTPFAATLSCQTETMMLSISFFALVEEVSEGLILLRWINSMVVITCRRCYTPVKPM